MERTVNFKDVGGLIHQLTGQSGIGKVPKIDLLEIPSSYETDFVNPVAMSKMCVSNGASVTQSKVAILLCTYHGQHFLSEQLDSFAVQSHDNWEVWASDDGSQDDTQAILKAYQQKWPNGRLSIHFGPEEGFVANFLSLTCKAGIDADYYAYSDQDDVWESDHLARALDYLKTVPSEIPAIYSSRTTYISKDGTFQGFSTLFTKQPSFPNALVQSIAGANTMVFNRAARLLLAKTPPKLSVVSHDWWAYMLVSGCGGRVFYDPSPGVRYRQHDSNTVGQNVTILAKIVRVKALLVGRFKSWNCINLNALYEMTPYLTEENRRILALFIKARSGSTFSRICNLYRSGVYRQTFIGNFGLFIAALLRKL